MQFCFRPCYGRRHINKHNHLSYLCWSWQVTIQKYYCAIYSWGAAVVVLHVRQCLSTCFHVQPSVHMHKGYSTCLVCVCLCVFYSVSCNYCIRTCYMYHTYQNRDCKLYYCTLLFSVVCIFSMLRGPTQ